MKKPDSHVLSNQMLGRNPDDHIGAQYRAKMRAIAETLDEFFNEPGKPKTVAFALLVTAFGEDTRVNYISNGHRGDMLKMMQEYLNQEEKPR